MLAAYSLPFVAGNLPAGTEPDIGYDAFAIFGVSRKEANAANQLIVNKGREDEKSLMFNEFSDIEFRLDNIMFNNTDLLTIPISSLYTIHFEEKASQAAVESVETSPVQFIYNGTMLSVTGLPENSSLEIYAVSGIRMMSLGRYNGEPISLRDLPAGIYVANSAGHYFKFIKK